MEKRKQNNLLLREFRVSDVVRVTELESICNPLPWREADLNPYAADTQASNTHGIGRVAVFEDTGEVAGYVCANQVEGEAEILVLGVDSQRRRHGIAKALLSDLNRVLKSRGCLTVHLEVRQGNLPARSLYLSAGFRENGIRKGYYSDTGEDACIMRCNLSG